MAQSGVAEGKQRANPIQSLGRILPGELSRHPGIEYAAEVTADSRYEAALALARFGREDGWVACPPGPRCEFRVKVLAESPITHTVPLKRIETFARHGAVTGPRDILRKQRIRKLLGIEAGS